MAEDKPKLAAELVREVLKKVTGIEAAISFIVLVLVGPFYPVFEVETKVLEIYSGVATWVGVAAVLGLIIRSSIGLKGEAEK